MVSDSRQTAIREIAYSKWEKAGWPSGDGVEFWLDAEHEFISQHSTDLLTEAVQELQNASLAASDPPPLKMTKVGGSSRKRAG